MISFITELPNDIRKAERFLWCIENALANSENQLTNIEIIFFGKKDIKMQSALPYRFFKAVSSDFWDNIIALSEKAFGDILILSDINILYTDFSPIKLKEHFNTNTIVFPEIVNSSDNRIIDYGTINYKNNLIYLYRGLLFDNERIPSINKVTNSSQLSIAVRKEFFLNYANKVDCFDKLFHLCQTNNFGMISCKDFVVYYCGDINLPSKTIPLEYKDDKLIYDILKNNVACLNRKHLAKDYLLVKIGDIDEYEDLAKCFKLYNVDIIGEYSFKNDSADNDIDLFHILPLEIVDYHTAIIYFVSSFTCLNRNCIWFSARDTSYDIVIDKNLNVLHLFQIANNLI